MALPPPAKDQTFCNVSALEGGLVSLAEEWIKHPFAPDLMMEMPSLCFLLQHSTRKDKFLFDMGLRKDLENYPPVIVEQLNSGLTPAKTPQDVVESLARGGLAPDDIDWVAISHLHWDHIGNTSLFEKSTFILAEESKSLISPGYPDNPRSAYAANVPLPDQTNYLDAKAWTPIGPFPRGHDFYNDGSVYLIDSPGHLRGHINILVRTSSDGSWLFLAGDSVHHWEILNGEAKVAVGAPWDSHFCIHEDLPKAEEHIEHIKQLNALPRTQVILTHDVPWYAANKNGPAFFPGVIPVAKGR
ncbi:Metallo-hydrolase/oxidoreductase [Coprinopsis marcescibilis]|uniref:Metallo-hydrolase/oxidoreductase n=1 Tax=Coprinopsis marcescibilis TaxID=230819 RepID=A0A5C3L5L3_COPMA|nr:Metallo-hydrolase/oxidoreductase [Coprinopsis marcescibilis]